MAWVAARGLVALSRVLAICVLLTAAAPIPFAAREFGWTGWSAAASLTTPTASVPQRPAAEAPPIDTLIDPLPIVVRDLPDDASQRAIAAFDAATLFDPASVEAMFRHAWSGLRIPLAQRDLLDALGEELLPPTATLDATDPFGMRGFDANRVDELLRLTLPSLSRDRRNADRLNNAAVALFLFEVSRLYGRYESTAGSNDVTPGSGRFHGAALLLLTETDRSFASNRAVLLNLGFMRSLEVQFGNEAVSELESLQLAVAPVSRWLARHPDDRTARFLLGNLRARLAEDQAGLDVATRVLAPLHDDPEALALAHIALGDAHMALALRREEVAPFAARDLARSALAEYDLALADTEEPGAFAGRAAALEMLGRTQEAAAAQAEGVERAPRSAELLLGLSLLQQRAGDLEGFTSSSATLLELALDGWDPPVRTLRYTVGGLREEDMRPGYLGYSYGVDQDHATIFRTVFNAAGGYTVTPDLFPQPRSWLADERHRRMPSAAAIEVAVEAAVAAGDAEAATAVVGRYEVWTSRVPGRLSGTANLDGASLREVADVADAARLVSSGEAAASDVDPAATRLAIGVLERSGRYAEAARLCQQAELLECAGINAYLAGDVITAAAALGALLEQRTAEKEASDDPDAMNTEWMQLLRLRAAEAARAAGKPDDARRQFTLAVQIDAGLPLYRAIGFAKLGELDLDSGNPASAAANFSRSLTELTAAGEDGQGPPRPELAINEELLIQTAHNNRGIARLWDAQSQEATPPDCLGAADTLCREAQADFAAALRSDPANPVYLLNMGWVMRLLGDEDAARAYLLDSLRQDPSLYPTHNDLGVLAARDGQFEEASQAFNAALAANPRYDLALWNLGVLEMHRGPVGLATSQSYFARAIAANPALRDDYPELKTDERVYRVAFDQREAGAWAFGRAASLAAGAFGSVALVAAIWQAIQAAAKAVGSDQAYGLGPRFASGVVRRLAPVARRAGPFLFALPPLLYRVISGVRSWQPPAADPRAGAIEPGGRATRFGWMSERWLPWLSTVPVLLAVTIWPVWQGAPETRAATLVLMLLVLAAAIVVHEVGHELAAAIMGARVRHTHWVPGLLLAPLLLPLQLSCGPYVCHRVLDVAPSRAWWVYLGGPLANTLAAVAAYAVFLVQPLPALRLAAEVQLAAAAFALLPFLPLDGHELLERMPGIAGALSFMVAVLGIILALGIL